MTRFQEVSRKTRKIDGLSIVTGKAKYTDDFVMPGMLRVKVLRSPFASARIKKIDVAKARRLPGVAAVLTWRDLPRRLYCTTGVGHPEPSPYDTYVLDKIIRFVGDEVAIVGAETEPIAQEAIKLIEVEYEVLTPLLDPRKAMDKGAPVVHAEKECHIKIPVLYEPEINRVARIDAEVGDVERALSESAIVLKREFEAQTASHVPTEPHCALSYLDEHGRLTVISSTQVPFHSRRKLARVFDLPVKNIRVIKPRLGGGFGGKQDVLLEPFAAAITLKTGRPAKYRLTRPEVFVGTRLRHNMICDVTIGSDKEGNLKAFDLYALTNTGAYGTQGFTVTTCA
ncbi:MAG: molybdopterin cofactor-binding domain-containing protein, partial [Candidatus Auribacterota bacterium]|nr:molybdopterin cofactor-binding domain-containing protein [Candidatus Auribacterota bacterium]